MVFSATAGSATNITGTVSATDQPDVFTASGTLNIFGTLSVTEAQDSFVANASGGIIGSMAATDIADALVAAGGLSISGTFTAIESGDVFEATGTLSVSGTFEAVDTPDALTASGYTGDAQPVLLRFVGLATDAQLVLRRVSDNTVVFSGTPTDGQIEYTALEPLQVSLTSTAAEIAMAVWMYAERTLTTASSSSLTTEEHNKLMSVPTALENALAHANRVVENNLTNEDLTKLKASVLLGKVTGAGTGSEKFRDLTDSKDRITATIDSLGNRTVVILDAA